MSWKLQYCNEEDYKKKEWTTISDIQNSDDITDDVAVFKTDATIYCSYFRFWTDSHCGKNVSPSLAFGGIEFSGLTIPRLSTNST